MKVNLAIEIKDIEGNPIQGEPMLLSKLVGNALFTAEKKTTRFEFTSWRKRFTTLRAKSR